MKRYINNMERLKKQQGPRAQVIKELNIDLSFLDDDSDTINSVSTVSPIMVSTPIKKEDMSVDVDTLIKYHQQRILTAEKEIEDATEKIKILMERKKREEIEKYNMKMRISQQQYMNYLYYNQLYSKMLNKR